VARRIALLLGILVGSNAAADIAIDPATTPHNGFAAALVMGWEFTPTQSIEVTALGWFDHEQDGFLNGPHEVGLFRVSDEALLVSASIASTSVLVGNFRYEDVAATVLLGGSAYVVAGVDPAGFTDRYPVLPDFATDLNEHPNLTVVQERILESGILAFPTTTSPGGPVGANFQFVLPEPSASLLVGLLTGLAWGVRGAAGTIASQRDQDGRRRLRRV
jgi:hypothetical protein